MMRRYVLLFLAAALVAPAQTYNGPRPPKPDIVYLKHASELLPAEMLEAKEEKKGDNITYAVEGANSPVSTPLASPIFLIVAQKLPPQSLELYKLETRNGRREITMGPKKPGRPIRVEITRLTNDQLWQIEVEESLEPGEYSFTPGSNERQGWKGSNQVFCFQVR
jgi:hypothetical protein